ncbi:MAG: DUF932 domain-containing protein [Brasilonema angustatum HA4187-MV1]|nr:DUF932 domain-containing protein [Brasilonema angustatum HA4187-MV1]
MSFEEHGISDASLDGGFNLEFDFKPEALKNEQYEQGFHFDKDKVKLAASEIKERFKQNGYKGMINDAYYKGVGVAVESEWSLDEKLKHAGLNWETETSLMKYGKNMEFLNTQQQAVYRGDTGLLFGVTNDTWQPYQNREVVNAFDEFCAIAGIEMERLGSLRDGRLVFASAVVNESWAVMGTDDVICGRLILTNSHEYGAGLTAKLSAVRLVCCNGITRKVNVGTRSIGHNQSFSKASVNAILESSKNNFANLGQLIDELAQTPISNREAKDFLIETLGDKEENSDRLKSFYDQSKLVRQAYYNYANHTSIGSHLEASNNNAWELLNCVTEQLNHHSRSTGESHIHSMWHGGKAQVENRVLNALEHNFLKRQNKNTQAVTVKGF